MMKALNETFHFIPVVALLLAVSAVRTYAQEVPDTLVVPQGYELADSVVYRHVAGLDTTLVGKDILMVMPSRATGGKADVEIYQTDEVAEALKGHVASNSSRAIQGYRVRIFFDNKQSARTESEEVLRRFESVFHGVKAYRTYANPYFKVTVGDFRTKSDAMELLTRIKPHFQSAFIVKEPISYPVVDKENAYVVDTVQVLRPIAAEL